MRAQNVFFTLHWRPDHGSLLLQGGWSDLLKGMDRRINRAPGKEKARLRLIVAEERARVQRVVAAQASARLDRLRRERLEAERREAERQEAER